MSLGSVVPPVPTGDFLGEEGSEGVPGTPPPRTSRLGWTTPVPPLSSTSLDLLPGPRGSRLWWGSGRRRVDVSEAGSDPTKDRRYRHGGHSHRNRDVPQVYVPHRRPPVPALEYKLANLLRPPPYKTHYGPPTHHCPCFQHGVHQRKIPQIPEHWDLHGEMEGVPNRRSSLGRPRLTSHGRTPPRHPTRRGKCPTGT